MAQRKTEGAPAVLEFEAKLVGVKPVIGTVDNYGQSKPGRLEVTFAIAQPGAPRKPEPDYEITNHGRGLKPRPEVPEAANKGEAAAAFGQRQKETQREQARYDAFLAEYTAELAKWEQALADLSGRMLSYAQLVGLAAVFGNTDLRVVVHPKTRLLEGFGVSLLAPAGEGE